LWLIRPVLNIFVHTFLTVLVLETPKTWKNIPAQNLSVRGINLAAMEIYDNGEWSSHGSNCSQLANA
jgi:hypothetical protein